MSLQPYSSTKILHGFVESPKGKQQKLPNQIIRSKREKKNVKKRNVEIV